MFLIIPLSIVNYVHFASCFIHLVMYPGDISRYIDTLFIKDANFFFGIWSAYSS